MSHFHARLGELLNCIPKSWHGTTYPNDRRFIGRQPFIDVMLALLFGSEPIDSDELNKVFPEDYLRVGSPLSALLEVVRAVDGGYSPSQTYSFASNTLPLIITLLSSKKHVYVYGRSLLSSAQQAILRDTYGCNFSVCGGAPQPHADGVVVQVTDNSMRQLNANVDAVVGCDGMLYIVHTDKVHVEDYEGQEGIHTLRKRLGCPPPTVDAIALLRGEEVPPTPDASAVKQHLKELGGLGDAKGDVVITTVGLSAIAGCLMSACELGQRDIDVLMCSTAYGGSSQQTEILSKTCGIQKHTFDIQGVSGNVFEAIKTKLHAMKSGARKPLTLIQLEYPTNPDMKDCDLSLLEAIIKDYTKATRSKVVLMLDTTFSPQSQSAAGFKDVPVIVFNSLSKSVSGGYTTGGSLVANHHPLAQRLLEGAHTHVSLFDTYSKGCQLSILGERHGETEDRILAAHRNAIKAAAALEESVARFAGEEMKVNFVTHTQMNKKVTPATFSFNLPAPVHMRSNKRALDALAQTFVDRLVEHYPQGVKPCVSFGQKNTWIYVTVPATSTQGVISEKDKSKQAVGGVQLVRFSFPPAMDHDGWNNAMNDALASIYSGKSSL